MRDYIKNPFYASTRFADKHAHLGVCGSVAAYKAADLLRSLLKLQINVSVTLTSSAEKFVSPLLFRSLGANTVYKALFNSEEDDVFGHLRPGEQAQVFVLAPVTANFLGKLAAGIADDMLLAQCMAYNGKLLLAPAMNPRMWANKANQNNVGILKERGFQIVGPGTGETACGETGKGRLADLQEIFLETLHLLSPQDMAGLKVMVTMGPTREMWDGARFFSNPSSGLMGAALATSAWLRGAEVYAICGADVNVMMPGQVKRISAVSAKDMLEEAEKIWPEMDWGIFCAAVADFAPKRPENADSVKLKKVDFADSFELLMLRNPDILATLAAKKKDNQKILGFAAEICPDVSSLAPYAQKKLASKNTDMIAANRVNSGTGSFGANETAMLVVDCNGLEESWAPMSKADIAWELCSWLLRL